MNTEGYTEEAREQMREIAEHCMGEAAPYCEAACPMHTDVQGYVNLIAEGQYEEALGVVRDKLFLPATLGRICAHPCEEKCKRGEMKSPLSVAALKRFVADRCDSEDRWNLDIETNRDEGIAIIGAGPAGAQAALDLRKKGYNVTIFEKLPHTGGMLRVGIPEYRLPRHIIDFEYSLLEKLGVEIRCGVEIGKDITFDELQRDFDAVLVAVGAHKSVILPIPGNDLPGVLNAVDFLRDISLGNDVRLGKKIVVIGGGNVAIDVARTARRAGSEEIHLVALESREEMPAHSWEIDEAAEEGIIVHHRIGPEAIIEKDGKVSAFLAKKCLSVFDDNGTFSPVFCDDETTLFDDVDNVIFAIGQSVDNSCTPGDVLETQRGGRFVVDPVTLQTAVNNVFAAGDATGRSVIAVEAMAEGRKAALSIDRYLTGADLRSDRGHEGSYETQLETSIDDDVSDLPRIATAKRAADERIQSFEEVDLGLTEIQAREEASRCLKCECKLCMKECEMLNDFTECPGKLFREILQSDEVDPLIPYSCNMCKQCTLVCPKEFSMMDRFMDMRVSMVAANEGKSPMKGHKAIDMHQTLGFSRFFNTSNSANGSKDSKDSNGSKGSKGSTKRVFIPGCSLPSYSPELVENILKHLQEKLPGTGSILKCCGKPTKALGQVEKFHERYGELQAEIDRLGAEEIIVACQSCYVTMKQYSPNQRVRSLWEVLPEIGLPEKAKGQGNDSDLVVAIHDSCPTRDIPEIHRGVRWVMNELGYQVEDPPHTEENTRCCGFGGMVVPANPDLALRVMKRRTDEFTTDHVVTYCAACRESMVRGGKKAVHILDLVFRGPWTSTSEFPGVSANPLTGWVNRFKAKRKMNKAA